MKKLRRFAVRLDECFALRDELRTLCRPETIVCRCEDVAYSQVSECGSWREAKLHTRCGMGACQGRICGPQTEFILGWRDAGVRPPILPARVSSIAQTAEEADGEATMLEHAKS